MPNLQFVETPTLNSWYQQPLGQLLSQAEDRELGQVLPKCYGQYLLQLGGHELLPAVQTSPAPFRFGVTAEKEEKTSNFFIYGTYTQLPIETESINIAVLAHSLETVSNPEAILTEVWRTLAPDGHLIILGFNPWSLWGGRHLFTQHNPPWNTHFHSAQKICNWVIRMDGDITLAKSFFFRPPLQNPTLLNKLSWLEAVGLWLWPHMGAVYLLSIQKRTASLIPSKPDWRWQTEFGNKEWASNTGGFRRG